MGNVMLTGGNTMFEGLPQMLYKKLKSVRILLMVGDLRIPSRDSPGSRLQVGKARAASLKIVASKDRQISAWVGGAPCPPPCQARVRNHAIVKARSWCIGSVLASLPTWEEELITQEDYEEAGPEVRPQPCNASRCAQMAHPWVRAE